MKASQADLSILEFLDISNFDFTVIGALQTRPGSATFLTGPAMNATVGYNAVGFSNGGFVGFIGAVNNSLAVTTGASYVGGQVSSIYEFSNLNGQSYIMFSSKGFFNYAPFSFSGATVNIGSITLSQVYFITGQTFGYLLDPADQIILNQADSPVNKNWDFTTFVNRLFFCNGDHFYKWDGNNNYLPNPSFASFADLNSIEASVFQAPRGTSLWVSYSQWQTPVSGGLTLSINSFPYKYGLPPGTSLFAGISATGVGTSFSSITYTYSWGYVNERGFYGPVSSPITVSGATTNSSIFLFGFSTAATAIGGFSVPSGYGIGYSGSNSYFGNTLTVFSGIGIYRDNGPGTGRYFINYAIPYSTAAPSLGWARFEDRGYPQNLGLPEPTCIFATLPPQYVEIYNNQMFMCGFSQAPSTVQFSDIGNPESVQPQNNFDVRTNDGDWLTGMKSALQQLFFFKNKSFHVLTGSDPTNFVLNPISDQYGCISNNAVAVYESYLLFLDRKGICMFNGSNPQIISSKLDPIFANMNIQAAQNNAWMLHNKQRNQIWCGIPVNGSTLINQIVVYDYLLNAWTHFDGLNTACATPGYGSLPLQTVYFGGYSSYLGVFGSSITSDFGLTITAYAQTQYFSDLGQSVEKMWRRLMINTISGIGATSIWNIAFYANYMSAISLTASMGGISLTARYELGISAKALSVRFSTSTTTDTLQLQGLTVESRYQRAE